MNGLIKYAIICFLVSLVAPSIIGQPNYAANARFIKTGKLFDSESGKILSEMIIVIEGNRISDIGSDILIPADAIIIDLSNYTVLPGLIDGHTHLMTLDNLNDETPIADNLLFEGNAIRVLRGAKRAKSWLENGFTSIWDLGDSGAFLDVALKKSD